MSSLQALIGQDIAHMLARVLAVDSFQCSALPIFSEETPPSKKTLPRYTSGTLYYL